MRTTRRTLQLALGLLWLLDGALQCQRFMFTSAFGRTVIAPTGIGQPGFVAHPVHWAATIAIEHPVLANAGFAIAQLAIGAGLLWRRSVRLALAASVMWGAGVWYLGEGVGGLTTGETLLTGAPGAALLYSLISLLAFPDREGSSSGRPSRLAVPIWLSLWLMGAGLQVTASNDTGSSLTAMFHDAGSDAGGWIGRIDGHLARLHIVNGYAIALIVVEVLIGVLVVVPGRLRLVAMWAGIVLAAATWLLVQGLGELTSGHATDPNSGPLIVLLAVAVLGSVARPAGGGTPAAAPADVAELVSH